MVDDDLREKFEKAVPAAVVDAEAVAFAPSFDIRNKIGLKGSAKELLPPERIEAAQEVVIRAAADFFASNENQRLDMLEALWKWRDKDDYGCGFHRIGAVISRDRGRLFHAIAGSHFARAGRLIDGFMGSGLMAEVKGLGGFSAHAFA